VFGSVAKGTDTERSDVDLVVIGTASLLELSEALHHLEQELGRAIHLSLYAPDEWRELISRDAVVAQIAQGPKLQLDG
jgi:predicted nucleotidyltransferase